MSTMPRPTAPFAGTDGWQIYTGGDEPHDGIDQLPPPPPWRTFDGGPVVRPRLSEEPSRHGAIGAAHRATSYQVSQETVEMVNAALYLRRPLLVTGKPGTGKSTLAESIAWELGLGPVLRWPVNSHSTLTEGQYRYDALGRLHEASLHSGSGRVGSPPDIGRYLQLGPLGTALLPQVRPRVLLIDELDKSNVDLPNDLLHVLEEGGFDIPELARLPDSTPVIECMIFGSEDRVPIHHGRVQCRAFPVVVITSNAEREFPPAFLRRVLRVDITPPDETVLGRIVAAQLGADVLADSRDLIDRFLQKRESGDLATDQLLNAVFLATSGVRPPQETRERLAAALMRSLDGRGG